MRIYKTSDGLRLIITVVFLVVTLIPAFAQKQANIWYFGDHAGLDFNTNPPSPLLSGQTHFAPPLLRNEGCSSISDSAGNLLFYTNGVTIWNRKHKIMLNGDSLKGHTSSTQASLIVPKPHSSRYFYVFTTDALENRYKNGLQYSIVDMCLDSGFGGILPDSKNKLLIDTVCEKLAGVKHANNEDYWIITHRYKSNAFCALRLTAAGIADTVVSQPGAFDMQGWGGQMIISPNGKKIAYAIPKPTAGSLTLFDFDAATGAISNEQVLSGGGNEWGVAFSPDNSKLYTSRYSRGEVCQYDLLWGNTTAIIASKIVIFQDRPESWLDLQLGPDGNIYFSWARKGYLSAIIQPNNRYPACQYIDSAVYLGGKSASFGLPNFIAGFNYHNTRNICPADIKVTSLCLGDTTRFEVLYRSFQMDSLRWLFQDPLSSVKSDTARNSYHLYTDTGLFYPVLLVFNGTFIDTTFITIRIVKGQKPVLGPDLDICQDSICILSVDPAFANVYWPSDTLNTSDSLLIKKSGTYYVITRDSNQCYNKDTVSVKFYPVETLFPIDTLLCVGDTIILDAGLHGGNGFNWSNGDTTRRISVSQAGLYTVRTVYGSCWNEDSVHVITGLNGPFYIGPDTVICVGESITLSAGIDAEKYLWSTGDTLPDIIVDKERIYSASALTVCGWAHDTIYVKVIDIPHLSNSQIVTSCSTSVTLQAGTANFDYLWLPGQEYTSQITVDTPGIYILVTSDEGRCAVADTFILVSRCPPLLWLPNAFTPNRDPLNNMFIPVITGYLTSYKLHIFNRWGEQVFESYRYNKGWDGTYLQQDCAEGTYYWVIYYKSEYGSRMIKGTVMLLR